MSRRSLTAYAFGVLLVGLASCDPRVTTQPYLYIMQGGISGKPALVPLGYGWPPGSKIELFLYSEPKNDDGTVYAAPAPRLLGTVTADGYGRFGLNGSSADKFPVDRGICGPPPAWAMPYIVARDVTHNLVKFPEPSSPNPAPLWFTFQPCR